MPSIYFDDLQVGMRIPDLVKGPMSAVHIMRWSSAIELWHRIHFDQNFAETHDALPGVLVNGSWKQHVLLQLLTDWAGDTGWVWRLKFQYRGMNVAGETLTARGEVDGIKDCGNLGLSTLRIGIVNEHGEQGTLGRAAVVFPRRGAPPLPYPFEPAALGPAKEALHL